MDTENHEGFEYQGQRIIIGTISNLDKQEYSQKPLYKKDVHGLSSRAIFKFMVTNKDHIDIDEYKHEYPSDVDDWERNRALLLWYPEWKIRLKDMSIISKKWSNLVENWDRIEKLYDEDYEKYGNKAYENGECCQYIIILILNYYSLSRYFFYDIFIFYSIIWYFFYDVFYNYNIIRCTIYDIIIY
jgi:hypothetical protein